MNQPLPPVLRRQYLARHSFDRAYPVRFFALHMCPTYHMPRCWALPLWEDRPR